MTDAGRELSDLQLRVPADWIFMREDTEKARSLDSPARWFVYV